MVYGSILMPFTPFFNIDCSFKFAREFSFSVAPQLLLYSAVQASVCQSYLLPLDGKRNIFASVLIIS